VRWILLIVSLLICPVTVAAESAAAPVFREEVYQRIIDLALSQFWGNAKLQDGSVVQP
jgi:hypothetical protein